MGWLPPPTYLFYDLSVCSTADRWRGLVINDLELMQFAMMHSVPKFADLGGS